MSGTRAPAGVSGGTTGKRDWRQHGEAPVGDGPQMMARLSAGHVRWLIEEAYHRSIAAGRTPPEAFAHARLELGPAEKPARHPALAVAPPLPVEEARLRGASLHDLVECQTWIPGEEEMAKLDLELGQIASSPLQVSPEARDEQRLRVVEKLADEMLTPEFRARLSERLHETALMLAAR